MYYKEREFEFMEVSGSILLTTKSLKKYFLGTTQATTQTTASIIQTTTTTPTITKTTLTTAKTTQNPFVIMDQPKEGQCGQKMTVSQREQCAVRI